ncbi:MAG: hypothetical protein EBS05_08315 [Proteobacteria bacterium]|nr:hypothetical protein [Pseudomonadota bacterium]
MKCSTSPSIEERLTKLEARWREVSGCYQTKLDTSAALTPEESRQLRKWLAELWPGVGMVQAEGWSQAQAKAFNRKFAAQLETWAAKEARGVVCTLDEFMEQARALGSCQVIAEREAKALSDAEFDQRKRHLEKSSPSKTLDVDSPAYKFARGRLGVEFLAWPILQRQWEARSQGFWHVFGRREEQRFARAQMDLEAEAKSKLMRWSGCRIEDASFHKAADCSFLRADVDGADQEKQTRELLLAATLYEYARESRKLRGLLFVSARCVTQRKPNQSPVFDGLDEVVADKALGGWFCFLREFAAELTANTSFNELWRDQRERVERALWWFPKSKTGTTRMLRVTTLPEGYSIPVPPVGLAFEAERQNAMVWEAVKLSQGPKPDGLPERARSFAQDGVEVLVLKVNWEDFDNRALGESFARLASSIRPKKCPEPASQGHNQHSEFLTPLKELAAMRRVSWEKSPDKELYRAAKRARERFMCWFPFGDEPENGLTFKQRAKNGGTPSASKARG